MDEFDFVQLVPRRNRGWPWPEDSWGLTPMYGADGWCQACGVPLQPQSGSLMLQRRNLSCVGAWLPHWQYDAFCVESTLADKLASRFDVQLRDVRSPRGEICGAQFVAPSLGDAWFDPNELAAAAVAVHGTAGARCTTCDTWRWMPIGEAQLPLWRLPGEVLGKDVAASPEWFGDGWKCFRQVIFRRELAELVVGASPRDFDLRSVDID